MPANVFIILSIVIPAALLVVAVVNAYREGARVSRETESGIR